MLPTSCSPRWLAACLLILSVVAWGATPAAAQPKSGAIAGVVIDGETGDPLPGANVTIAGTATGTATDLNGRYAIKGLAPGAYDVVFSFIGFQQKTVTGVEVEAGTTTQIDITLAPETAQLEEVIVSAEAARDSEAGLLKQRQKAAAVSDAISAEAIGRSGSSTAADALEKIPGASVQDGKYVNLRGVQGRYVNTQLNGADLPSADPDRNAVPLDLFPGALLDNVVLSKTFTPDKPGNFTGGNINIGTKSFPENLSFSLSSSITHDSEIGFGEDMLMTTGGLNELPDALRNGSVPSIAEAYSNEEAAQRLSAASRAFTPNMVPAQRQAPVNQSYGLSFGNQFEVLGGRPLGIVASLSYSQDASGYENGTTGQYKLPGDVVNNDALNQQLRYNDVKGSRETLVGGLMNLSFRPHADHELGLNVLYNRSDEETARFQSGSLTRDLTGGAVFQTRTLQQTLRTLRSLQARGQHMFGLGQTGIRLEWNSTLSRSEQDDPDHRFFSNHYRRDDGGDTTYTIAPSIYSVPARYFRNLEETTWSNDLSVTIPVGKADVKVGGSYLQKDREFRERRFDYQEDQASYRGNPGQYFGEQAGLIGQDDFGRYRFGTYLVDATQSSNNYNGQQAIAAGFAMLDTPILPTLRFVGGVRVEHTDMTVATIDQQPRRGALEEFDLLPSGSLIYNVLDDMNVRLAYGRTLARPTFREFAPLSSFNFVGDYVFVGNPELERTTVHNLDMRWEWFVRPGEVLAASVFYKDFTNPIERVINPVASGANEEIQFRNVGNATVYGLELEARKRLDVIAPWLEYFQVGGNLTLTRSEIIIAEDEMERIRAFNPNAADTRDLQGQAPYVVNADVGYENPELGTSISVFYNIFGPRLHALADGPDLYEQARSTVDVVASQRVFGGFSVKASVKNAFNAAHEISQHFKGTTYVNQRYPMGRSISLGLKYDL